MIKIKSISDVISNSSNEAFCYKLDEDFERLDELVKKELNGYEEFTIIKSLDDVKKIIWPEPDKRGYVDTYESWEEFTERWAQCNHGVDSIPQPIEDIFSQFGKLRGYSYDIDKEEDGPYCDKWNDLTQEEKDELWEKYKHNYEPVVGYAYALLSNEDRDPAIDIICNHWWKIWCEKQCKLIEETFEPDTFYVDEYKEYDYVKDENGNWGDKIITHRHIIHYVGNNEWDSAFIPQWRKNLDDDNCTELGCFIPDDEITHDKRDKENLQLVLDLVKDYGKVSKATKEETERIKKAAREAGFDYRNGRLVKG